MYFNVNFNVFFKLIKVHLLVSELYIYQNARCNDKKRINLSSDVIIRFIYNHTSVPMDEESLENERGTVGVTQTEQ